MTTRCMIIEDEPLAQNVLKNYISQLPSLELVAVCGDALEAQATFAASKIDLLFLDINLPKLSGINFLKSLADAPPVIFTTAYPEFAIEGFDLDAADYLLKPFSFERFLKAVNKALGRITRQEASTNDFVFLKSDRRIFKVDLNDILYAEATGDYVKVVTSNKKILTGMSLKKLHDELPENQFIRVHKSYLIARGKIDFLEGNYIRIGECDIPIGASYRDEVFRRLGDLR